MARVPDHYTLKRVEYSYVERARDPQQQCSGCKNVAVRGPQDVRCKKGGFFVRLGSSCKHFMSDHAVADIADGRVQIGPTDI
jgi:hypothetical protein